MDAIEVDAEEEDDKRIAPQHLRLIIWRSVTLYSCTLGWVYLDCDKVFPWQHIF